MRIFGIHDETGCGYYRIRLPFEQLRRHGHDVTVVSGKKVVNEQAEQYPIIVAERVDKPEAISIWRRWRARHRLVYEIDDDIWNVDVTNWMAYRFYGKPEHQDAVEQAAMAANLVTVSTEPLAEVMRKYNDNVVVLPNCIPGWVFELPDEKDGRTLGWSGGASHGLDIAEVAPHIRRFLDRFPGWRCEFSGTDFRKTVKHEHAEFTPWINITDDAKNFYRSLHYDIGIAPLATTGQRGEFNRSKSHIKALEYAARGIPVVATDAEPYREFVVHGETGFLVRRDHEWLKYMSELASDDRLREEMGERAREHARQWIIEDRWRLWADVYGGL